MSIRQVGVRYYAVLNEYTAADYLDGTVDYLTRVVREITLVGMRLVIERDFRNAHKVLTDGKGWTAKLAEAIVVRGQLDGGPCRVEDGYPEPLTDGTPVLYSGSKVADHGLFTAAVCRCLPCAQHLNGCSRCRAGFFGACERQGGPGRRYWLVSLADPARTLRDARRASITPLT